MKKILIAFALMAGLFQAFAAADDMIISFSTPGIDRYADGRRVMSGESYALVWTAKGATFGGLSSECVPLSATDKLVMVAPLAKRGRCPVTVVEIAASEASQYLNGTFSLYLLDTRTKGADGKVSISGYVNGLPQVVNSFGLANADGSGISAGSGISGNMYAGAPVNLADVGVYTEIEAPQITAIKVLGARIRLEVKGMSATADYFVVPADILPGNAAPVMNSTVDAEGITFDAPEEPTAFFKVIGVRKFGATE